MKWAASSTEADLMAKQLPTLSIAKRHCRILTTREHRTLQSLRCGWAACDAVDGSSRRHLGAKMVAVEATIERGADHE